ncbi:MAG TPA: phasin family protein [Candidatus Dormibacteraeota bacterium]|nr:phasin family protein [Candidatus Dormibacteraeota bacterium]
MTEGSYDLNAWLETYQEAFAAFTRAQQDGFKALERFARFRHAVAGAVHEAVRAHTRATLSARAGVGTQLVAELLQKQAELGTQPSEKLKARAQEFSARAAEVQQTVGNFAVDAANRATAGAKKAGGVTPAH